MATAAIPWQAINPADVNVDERRLARALDVLRAGMDEGALPGGVVCALRRGQVFLHQAFGTLDGARPATTDTLYDLASVTKPMATGASVLTLVEQGRLTLAATLPALLGEPAAHLAAVSVHHLLTHTSGLPAWAALYENGARGLDAAVAAVLRQPPAAPPGEKYAYSCLGFVLLAKIVETVSGQRLDAFAREHVWEPLGLQDTGYQPDAARRERVAPTRSKEKIDAGDDPETALIGVVHDGNARAIEHGGDVSGNAGLFGTARDVAAFGEALRRSAQGATTCGEQLFGAPTLARCLENQIKPSVGAHTLLFFAQGNGYCPAGDLLSPRTVGHSGYAGTLLTLDPAHDLTVVLLTNRVFSDPDGAKWLSTRRKFLNALAAALC